MIGRRLSEADGYERQDSAPDLMLGALLIIIVSYLGVVAFVLRSIRTMAPADAE